MKIVTQLDKLKYAVGHNHALVPIDERDDLPDAKLYNDELERLGNGATKWQDAPWLYTECYLFRRISTFYSLSTHWKGYDCFARQKINTFRSSRPAVLELANRYKELISQLRSPDNKASDVEAEKILFAEMCEICLWGNATDLSLLTNLSYDDIQKLQGSKARKEAEKNILVNNLPAAYETLRKAKESGKADRRVDIVLDNAGFELYVDLILAGYLLSAGLATHIVLHPKSIPWFVSDVLPSDFAALLSALADPRAFYETATADDKHQDKIPERLAEQEVKDLAFLFQELKTFHGEGQIILRPNRFWTHAGSYWRLPHVEPTLFADLKTSELVIFKGDLNYRKLTADVGAYLFVLRSSHRNSRDWSFVCLHGPTAYEICLPSSFQVAHICPCLRVTRT
jgi:damage-control phosphatase, subfamily III